MSDQHGDFNIVANIGGNGTAVAPNLTLADGALNSAFNLGGSGNTIAALGVANNATNVLGSNNVVTAAAGTGLTSLGLSAAFNIGGSGNLIQAGSTTLVPGAGDGPLAIAGAIGKSGVTVQQAGTGIKLG